MLFVKQLLYLFDVSRLLSHFDLCLDDLAQVHLTRESFVDHRLLVRERDRADLLKQRCILGVRNILHVFVFHHVSYPLVALNDWRGPSSMQIGLVFEHEQLA